MIIWLVLLAVVMAGGAVYTFVAWPKNESTRTAWFWIQLLGIPFLLWALAYGLRWLYHEQECDRIDAVNETLRADREKAVEFARDPLAVLGYAYLTGAGTSNMARLIAEPANTAELPTGEIAVSVSNYKELPLVGDDDDPSRYRACFGDLIGAMVDVVRKIPHDAPFAVRLQLPKEADRDTSLAAWQACWTAAKLRPTTAILIEPEQGVMALDEWLDVRGGPKLERFVLFAAVQLREAPFDDSTEAAVALLLSWAPLAYRYELCPLAILHRPIEGESEECRAVLTTPLRFGHATGDQISDLWEAALESDEKSIISRDISSLVAGVSKTEKLSGIHDIDKTFDRLDGATGWLTLTLGIEHAADTKRPQLMAWREGRFRVAVAQPGGQTSTRDGIEIA
ncbi:hypothetical protein [Caballeronia sp. GAFFF2]|uniref:hypothetical protein n=1 Tax=Caballeronia sp. GAFFF2 TaxID=2921741 RepID=UPI0020290515|nr:hypothetical protein [Caballeronia sp. GAFFF2]